MELITLDEYKTAKGIVKNDQDVVLSGLITSVSSLVQKYIGRTFSSTLREITEVINLDYDTCEIYLEEWPVNEIVSLTEIDPVGADSTIHFPVPDTTYRLNAADGVLIRTIGTSYWPQGYGSVEVTYEVGVADVEDAVIPADLKQVTIDLVTYYHKEEWKESRNMRGASMMNEPINSYGSYSSKFPPHIQRVLDLYKDG
jgi:hypothetical protein